MLHFMKSWQMILTGLLALVAGVMFAAPATAGSLGDGKPLPTNPSSYYLLGAATNSSYATTYFDSYAGSIYGNWYYSSYQTNGTALRGYCPYGSSCYGVWGTSNSGIGVVSQGVWGAYGGGSQYGVYATSPHGFANNLVCDYADCWASVSNWREWVGSYVQAQNYYYHSLAADGTVRAVPMAASTQSIVSDEGSAQLVNGRAVVQIEGVYASNVNLSNQYRVFVTPNSADTVGLAVINKTATSFEVRELNKGTGSFSFDWRIDAVRKGEEANRMNVVTDAPQVGSSATGPAPATGDLPMLTKINEAQQNPPGLKK